MTTRREFWTPPAGEPVSVRFLDTPSPFRNWVVPRDEAPAIVHGPNERCTFCWAEAERKLSSLEQDRWADDGGFVP